MPHAAGTPGSRTTGTTTAATEEPEAEGAEASGPGRSKASQAVAGHWAPGTCSGYYRGGPKFEPFSGQAQRLPDDVVDNARQRMVDIAREHSKPQGSRTSRSWSRMKRGNDEEGLRVTWWLWESAAQGT